MVEDRKQYANHNVNEDNNHNVHDINGTSQSFIQTEIDPKIMRNQATINIGTIGHVAHGKSTLVRQISGVSTIKYKSELERNITIKLGYANAKIYECDNLNCSRPGRYKSFGSGEMRDKIKCTNCRTEIKINYIDNKNHDSDEDDDMNDDSSESCIDDEKDKIGDGKDKKENDNKDEQVNDDLLYQTNGYLRLKRHVSFVDCPGHDVLMATMLTGTAIMDTALLLIAANETCPQPQTQEHLFAVEIMGLDKLIIVQNKIDLVSREKAIEHREGIADFLKGTRAENCPVVPASCQLNVNVDAVLDFIVNYVPVPNRDINNVKEKSVGNVNENITGNEEDNNNKKNNQINIRNKNKGVAINDNDINNNQNNYNCTDASAKMVVIRSFDINKPGCEVEDLQGGIIGGSLVKGRLKIGDAIEIRPGQVTKERGKTICKPYMTKITSLKAETNNLDMAVPGGLIGVGTTLDPFFCKSDKLVGQVLGLVGKIPDIFSEINVEYTLFTKIAGVSARESAITGLNGNEQYLLNVGSTTTGATIKKLASSEDGNVRFYITKPVCCEIGERIAISRKVNNHWRLIGYGKIIDGKSIKPVY